MIERHYFVHAKINHLDGNQSYSWQTSLVTVKSFFPDAPAAYSKMRKELEEKAKEMGFEGISVEITCFCRC